MTCVMMEAMDDRTTAAAAIIDEVAEATPGDRAFLFLEEGTGSMARSRVLPLDDGRAVTFGRMASHTVTVDHELVSRNHARVWRNGAEIAVQDLGSRNGTRVNGNAITTTTRVAAGDEISIGPITVIVGVTTTLRRQVAVASCSELEERLDAEIDRAVRYRRPLGLIMLRVDGADASLQLALDATSRDLRKMDLFAQYADDDFAVVLPEADRAATIATARRLLTNLRARAPRARVCAGVAECPDDSTKVFGLISMARAALRSARSGGGSDGISAASSEVAPRLEAAVVQDPQMRRVYELVRKVAPAPMTVLVLGETGVGKEIVASELHAQSPRKDKPFVAVNCSALPENLLESELFGHERGAFTGADRRKIGFFEAAQGGTIFLDEVGEMPLSVQVKLLRVLEQRQITRVGGTTPVDIDARVVCATNRQLDLEVKRGRFREDLYFRIGVFTIVIPPLRDRRVEIIPLAEHFARAFAVELGQRPPTFAQGAARALLAHDWPGNVRELRNTIERAVVLSPDAAIDIGDLPENMAIFSPTSPSASDQPSNVRRQVADVERAAVVAALDAHDQNQSQAARSLGISRYALLRLMTKHGLKRGS